MNNKMGLPTHDQKEAAMQAQGKGLSYVARVQPGEGIISVPVIQHNAQLGHQCPCEACRQLQARMSKALVRPKLWTPGESY